MSFLINITIMVIGITKITNNNNILKIEITASNNI